MAAPLTVVSGKTCTLAQRLRSTGSDTSITITSTETPLYTTGVMKFGTWSGAEWISFTGVTAVSGTTYTLTGCTRGLDKDATSLTDNSTGGKKDLSVGTTGRYVLHSAQINKYVQNDADNTLSGNNILTGSLTATSTSKAIVIVQTVTTTERDALTGVVNGTIVYNSTTGEFNIYQAGAWSVMASGSTQPNMSLTVAGKGEEATAAEIIANTQTGGTSAELVVNPKYLGDASVTTSAGAGDAGKYVRANSSGYIDATLLAGTTITTDQILYSGTAGETLTTDQLVYLKSSDGKLYKATKDITSDTNAWNIRGIIVTGGAANATITYRALLGTLTLGSALTANTVYYLGTSGALTNTRPSMNSATIIPVIVGTTDNSGKLVCSVQRLQRRLFTSFTPTAANITITVGFPISYVRSQHQAIDGSSTTRQAGSGYYDVNSTVQYFGTTGTGALVYSAIAGGNLIFSASVNGSNDLVMTYVGSSVSGTNKIILEIFEAL